MITTSTLFPYAASARQYADAAAYGFIVPGSDEWKMASWATGQVAAAKAGRRLASIDAAGGRSYFKHLPGSVSDARFYAAYWLAVAARLTGSGQLANAATNMLALAQARAALPGSTLLFRGDADEIHAILQDAASTVERYAAGSPEAGAIISILTPSRRAVQAAMQDRSSSTTAARAETARSEAVATVRQATRKASFWLAVLGITSIPEGKGFQVWATRVGLIGTPLLAGALYYHHRRKRRRNGPALLVRDRKPEDGEAQA